VSFFRFEVMLSLEIGESSRSRCVPRFCRVHRPARCRFEVAVLCAAAEAFDLYSDISSYTVLKQNRDHGAAWLDSLLLPCMPHSALAQRVREYQRSGLLRCGSARLSCDGITCRHADEGEALLSPLPEAAALRAGGRRGRHSTSQALTS
jgi:hypothetical protein